MFLALLFCSVSIYYVIEHRLPYSHMYCVGWDVKHCSIQSNLMNSVTFAAVLNMTSFVYMMAGQTDSFCHTDF